MVKFARNNNLLGIIIHADIALHSPAMITTIKESGLVLLTHGEQNHAKENVAMQSNHGADGVLVDDVFTFMNKISV